MYNTSGLLSVPSVASVDGGATPRTPEIVNSLMAMTNPFDLLRGPRVAASPPSDTTSTSSNSSSTSPPSVQHTCSQLIKEGLKLTIQTKRRNNHNPPLSGSEESHNKHLGRSEELTPEDEERRRRRRERNKIAATKCRLKKRERTVNLVQESEILETQNHDLKSQIQDLENERKRLVDMLSVHRPSCSKLPFANAPEYQNPGYNAQCNNTIASTASVYSAPYCKLEVNCETSYHKSESTYHRIETVEEIGFNRPLTYHTFDSGVKEPMLPFCRSDLGDPGYMRTEPYGAMTLEGPQTYLRSPRHYQRPSALGVASCPDYESGKDILDSPNIAPTNYHHFDEDADNYSAGFPSGSCIT